MEWSTCVLLQTSVIQELGKRRWLKHQHKPVKIFLLVLGVLSTKDSVHKEAENCANIISQSWNMLVFIIVANMAISIFIWLMIASIYGNVYFHLAGDCFLVIIIFKSSSLPDRSCNLIVYILDVCDAILCLCSYICSWFVDRATQPSSWCCSKYWNKSSNFGLKKIVLFSKYDI